MRGRELLYPGPFGSLTAGTDKEYPIDYSHLNICGYALGAEGLPGGQVGSPDNTLFPMVNAETEYGVENKVKMAMPVFTGLWVPPTWPATTGSTLPWAPLSPA